MIDLNRETILTLVQAARRMPKRKGPVSPVTIWRWIKFGRGGVKLDGLKLPGGWVTSAEALQRFADELTQAERRRAKEVARQGGAAADQWADAVLDQAGIGV